MNKLLRECQRLASLLDGTESDIGYPGQPGTLGTAEVSLHYHARTQGWSARADWGHGAFLSTPSGDYPKDAIRGLKRLLETHLESQKALLRGHY